MQKDNFFQKVGGLLNTSSETFMLIALVSLFVLPIVMAKNLEPVVKSTYAPSSTPVIENVAQSDNTQDTAIIPERSSNVLGASSTRDLRTFVKEDVASLKFFDNYSSTLTESGYDLTVISSKRFGKVPVFKISNATTSTQTYELSAKVNGDLKVKTNLQKVLYVDEAVYSIDESTTFPLKILVSPDQEVSISVMSNKTTPSNISIQLKQVE